MHEVWRAQTARSSSQLVEHVSSAKPDIVLTQLDDKRSRRSIYFPFVDVEPPPDVIMSGTAMSSSGLLLSSLSLVPSILFWPARGAALGWVLLVAVEGVDSQERKASTESDDVSGMSWVCVQQSIT